MSVYYLHKLAFEAHRSARARWRLGELLHDMCLEGRVIKTDKNTGFINVSGVRENYKRQIVSISYLKWLYGCKSSDWKDVTIARLEREYLNQGQRIMVDQSGNIEIVEVLNATY